MKQEFVTLYGKAIIERDVLYFRSPYLPFIKTAFSQIGYEMSFVLVFIIQVFFREDEPKKYIGALLFGFLILSRLPEMYNKLVKRTYSNRISLF